MSEELVEVNMIYDKAKWHVDGRFPTNLPTSQALVHIGFFLGWAVNNALVSESFVSEFGDEITKFKDGTITGPQLLGIAGETLSSDELNPTGNLFAGAYYATGQYFEDYGDTMCKDLPSAYHVSDSQNNFEATSRILNRRFTIWRQTNG